MNPITDPDHRLVAANSDWTFVEVFVAVNGGAMYLVSTMTGPSIQAKIPSLWCLVVGLELAMLSGLATWVNWGRFVLLYRRWSDANMLIDKDKWPKLYKDPWVPISYWGAIVLGVASALCLPVAGLLLMWNFPSSTPALPG